MTDQDDDRDIIPELIFLEEGLIQAGFKGGKLNTPSTKNLRRWKAWYGASPKALAELYYDLEQRGEQNGLASIDNFKLKYFFMALNWLVTQANEHLRAGIWKVDEVTAREKTWLFVHAIYALEAEKIGYPFDENDDGTIFVLTVDGVHAPIEEPRTNPNSNWCSHKFKGAGLAYELGIAVHEPKLVWINGPFRAGETDMEIFRKPNGLQSKLLPGQMAIGDRGYEGVPGISWSNKEDDYETYTYKKRARARHETFNARIKRFEVLSKKFRSYHDHSGETVHDRHRAVFVAVCVVVQYDMENGHPLFEV
jgi:hypothetical protein